MNTEPDIKIDDRVAAALADRYAAQSRRSFLHRVTKSAFALLGVSLAAEVPLFMIPNAGATTPNPWQWCGLHGSTCVGTCPTPPTGIGQWIQCCPDYTACPLWHCCTYIDICSASTTCSAGPGTSSSGGQWCGSYIGTVMGSYLCTVISCGDGYPDSATCQSNCNPTYSLKKWGC
jgi:hypothetical protein